MKTIIITVIAGLCATSALRAADAPTVADLIKVLEDPAAKVQEKRDACAKLCRMETAAKEATGAVMRLAISDDPRLRAAGMETLGWIADDVDRVTPVLVQGFKDAEPAIRTKAATALFNIGLDAVPTLEKAATDGNPLVRQGALSALGKFGGEASRVAAVAVTALTDNDQMVRDAAEDALLAMRPPIAPTVDALKHLLEDPKTKGKKGIIEILATYHDAAKPALPVLKKLLRSEDQQEAFTAAVALSVIDNSEKENVKPILRTALRDKATFTRFYAATALLQIGEDADQIIPVFVETLKREEDKEYHESALGRLVQIGAPAVPELVKLVDNDSSELRTKAITALAGMGREGRQAIPTLLKLKNERDLEVLRCVLLAIGELGDPTKEVIETIEEKLRHENPAIRVAACKSLGNFGSDAAAAVETLVTCLADRNAFVRRDAFYALAKVGPKAKDAVSSLEKILTTGGDADKLTGGDADKLHAAITLLRIQKGHEDAQAFVKSALTDPTVAGTLRLPSTLKSLWALGVAGAPFRPDVVELLKDPFLEVRSEAAMTLFWIGIDKDAIKALQSAVSDPSQQVRGFAAFALGEAPMASAPDVVPALTRLLKDRSKGARITAAISILQLDPANKPARQKAIESLKWLFQELANAERPVRDANANRAVIRNIHAAAALGQDASEAVPSLTRIARRAQDPAVRDAAEKALKKITADK